MVPLLAVLLSGCVAAPPPDRADEMVALAWRFYGAPRPAPSVVWVSGQFWQPTINGYAVGVYYPTTSTAYVDASQTIDRVWVTVCHELLHAAIDAHGDDFDGDANHARPIWTDPDAGPAACAWELAGRLQ